MAELDALVEMLAFGGPLDENLRRDLTTYVREFFRALNDPATTAEWVDELFPTGKPMLSLRDVEQQAPVYSEEAGREGGTRGLADPLRPAARPDGRPRRPHLAGHPLGRSRRDRPRPGQRPSGADQCHRPVDPAGYRRRPHCGAERPVDCRGRYAQHGSRSPRRAVPAAVAVQDLRQDQSFAVRQVSVRRLLQSADAVRHVSHVRRVTHADAAARVPPALQRPRRAAPWHRDGTGSAVLVPCLQHHVEPGIPVSSRASAATAR